MVRHSHPGSRAAFMRGGAVLAVALAAVLLAASLAVAFERTEVREPCAHYDPLRQPFFGETHLHTGLSFDASIRFVQPGPRDAYRFAKGGSVVGVGPNGFPDRVYVQDRPLDFAAVTDHSEHFGEMGVCTSADLPGRFSFECQLLNGFWWQPGLFPGSSQRSLATSAFSLLALPNNGPSTFNTRLPMCVNGEADCLASEQRVWDEMRAAAEEAYDRTSKCSFTSFIAYEMTSTPLGQNWHRNVIFRNDRVVPRPITAIDIAREPNPDPNTVPPEQLVPGGPDVEKLWEGLRAQCLNAGNGCDVLTIPHNSNLAGGEGPIPPMFYDPPTAAFAAKRQFFEPLVEIYQDKGSSECRWDPRFKEGVQTTDEQCSFELLDSPSILAASGVTAGGDGAGSLPPSAFNERMYVRNILKDGLLFEQELGVNPFKLGIIAATDSHNGNPSYTVEDERFGGHLGIEDAIPVRAPSTIQNGSGGVAVVWAEENSRDAIFEALKRKETYGTSGTRPIVRFFGGWNFEPHDCRTNFVAKGYKEGVPMGGDLPMPPLDPSEQRPSFIVAAWMDDYIGTPLQQIQIIKGWVEGGKTQEQVFTVAGDPHNGATVDQQCQRIGGGFSSLCTVWHDPTFDPTQPAFYYVRALENPVCRYSTHWCQQKFGVNPLASNCAAQLTHLPDQLQADAALCCSNETTTPFVQPVIQERAWTSPIWYKP
jgi:hypothetical protein